MENKEEKMTENLPVVSNQVIKSRLSLSSKFPPHSLVCFILSAALVALLVKPLADVNMMGWWWWFFVVCNVCYLGHGMKQGWAKGDPANGLVIMTGPIAFYFWTMALAWDTYYLYKEDGPGWTTRKLEKKLLETDLVHGFDFTFLAQHRKCVLRLLKSCKVCVEEVVDEPWLDPKSGKRWDYLSIADTRKNMIAREALR